MNNITTLDLLEAWAKKHRYVTIAFGGGYQHGDGWQVTLSGKGKKIVVGEYDLLLDDDDMPTATIEDIIQEALRQWDLPE